MSSSAGIPVGRGPRDIGMSPRDRLADRLVRDGEPDPELVCATAPPLGSLPPPNGPALPGFWSIIGRAMPSSPPARGEATGAP